MAGMFYYPELTADERQPVLTGDEARHAVSVRRLRVGEPVSLTNGKGLLVNGSVAQIDSRPAKLVVNVESVEQQPAGKPVHLVAALPKGDRQKVLLDMAVQAGMDRFTPLVCERSVSRESKNTQDRWQRIVLEAMKQSRRTWLPEITATVSLPEFLASQGGGKANLLIASADGSRPDRVLPGSSDSGVVILVGPEGGFTDEELRMAVAAGARKLKLGNAVLRTETAAVLATGVVALLGNQE